MDKLIWELEQLTQQGLVGLARLDMDQFTHFMEQRSQIIDAITKRVPTAEEKKNFGDRIKTVLSYDEIFLSKMNKLKQEAADQIAKIDAGRVQRTAYDNMYESDSLFFDKKK